MNYMKMIGMLLLFFSATAVGLSAAASVRRTQRQLEQIKLSLEMMRCEISYALTPADKLFALLSRSCSGEVGQFYGKLSGHLSRDNISVAEAASMAMKESGKLNLPQPARQSMDELFASFGKFHTEGQLRLLELAQERVSAELEQLTAQKKNRCRCYEVLGVCTGLALVILVI